MIMNGPSPTSRRQKAHSKHLPLLEHIPPNPPSPPSRWLLSAAAVAATCSAGLAVGIAAQGAAVASVTTDDEGTDGTKAHDTAVTVTGTQTTQLRASPTTISGAPAEDRSASSAGRLVLCERGDGPDRWDYASKAKNGSHPLWHVESGSAPVNRVDGKLAKTDSARFHRMFSTKRFGGPGKSVTISYRGRATALRDRSGSSTVPGAKIGLKFPVSSNLTGYSKDDPRSVYGNSSQNDAAGPGSYLFLTGLTADGYLELARNGYGSGGWAFERSLEVGYRSGTWKDVTVTVDWLPGDDIRVRFWHNADGSGAPVYDVTDTDSPFASEPGFLWLRSDSSDWEYDHITVREQ